MLVPDKPKTLKTRPRRVLGPRRKFDVRMSAHIDNRLSDIAKELGTTKNSIVVIATLIFVERLRCLLDGESKLATRELELVQSALKELTI
jgi:hypothetical protein